MINLKKTIFNFFVIAAIFVLAIAFENNSSRSAFNSSQQKIIIDAGHGLPDGGAVADDGTVESELNLSIAKMLFDKLEKAGFECIMTREDENSIYTEGTTIHAKKVSDIKKRVAIAQSEPNALVVSIHMNTYPSSSVSGTQVFYKSSSELAKNVASEIQNAVNLKYQSESIKKIKPISSNIYLFNHINNDSILIECGFLTNKNDLERLKTFEFQDNLSTTFAEIISYKLTGSESIGN